MGCCGGVLASFLFFKTSLATIILLPRPSNPQPSPTSPPTSDPTNPICCRNLNTGSHSWVANRAECPLPDKFVVPSRFCQNPSVPNNSPLPGASIPSRPRPLIPRDKQRCPVPVLLYSFPVVQYQCKPLTSGIPHLWNDCTEFKVIFGAVGADKKTKKWCQLAPDRGYCKGEPNFYDSTRIVLLNQRFPQCSS